MEVFGGFGRRVLVSQTGTIAEGGSLDLGVFNVGQFPRLTGIAVVDSSQDNSSAIEFRFQAVSGTTLTTSTLGVSSGGRHFSVSNEANYVGLGITPANSLTPFSIVVFGELVR